MKILVVEDEDPKRRNVLHTIHEIVVDASIEEAKSVTSALKALKQDQFDLVLLDMSLPSFDVGPGESGGRPQGFGGTELLRSMDRMNLSVPVIVVTAYEAFSSGAAQISLDALRTDLMQKFPNLFRGLVFYDSIFSTWSDELRSLIQSQKDLR
jgi:CheY-like chemotaxis protein